MLKILQIKNLKTIKNRLPTLSERGLMSNIRKYLVPKQDLDHSGHETSIIKETKKVKLTTFEQFIAIVRINVSQILLNLPCQVFFNTFQRSSDRPRIEKRRRTDWLKKLIKKIGTIMQHG